MQLPLFTRSIRFGCITIHNFEPGDLQRFKGRFEYVPTIGTERKFLID